MRRGWYEVWHGSDLASGTANPLIGLAAIIITGLVTYFVTRLTDRAKSDASLVRSAADREISVRAEFVTHLSTRIRELEERVDAASRRERELIERYRVDIDAIDSRYRHLTNSLVFHVALMRRSMLRAGMSPPEFTGWDSFLNEGGFVRDEWSAAVSDQIAENPRGEENDG